MRLRFLLLVLASAVVVVFTLLNWEAFTQPVAVNLGWGVADLPLPLLVLGLLVLVVLGFLVAGAAREAYHRRLARDQARALQSQRELAERAEASRFTDLRQMLDGHLRESRERDARSDGAREQAMARTQRELRSQMEQLHRALATRLGEMEARLDVRLLRLETASTGGVAEHAPVEDPRQAHLEPPDQTPHAVHPR